MSFDDFHWSRRTFLFAAAAGLSTVFARSARAHPPRAGRVLLLGADADNDTWRSGIMKGARLGAEEAGRTAALFGRSFELTTEARVADVRAVLAACEPDALGRTVADARRYSVPVLNLASTDDALRAACTPNLFHVIPSERIYRESAAAANVTVSGSEPTATDTVPRPRIWESTLEQHGAAQLNTRFERRFHEPMSSAAWIGWAAAKAVAEWLMREPATLESLRGLAFDAHKGELLRFDGEGQLRYPLVYAENQEAMPKILPMSMPAKSSCTR